MASSCISPHGYTLGSAPRSAVAGAPLRLGLRDFTGCITSREPCRTAADVDLCLGPELHRAVIDLGPRNISVKHQVVILTPCGEAPTICAVSGLDGARVGESKQGLLPISSTEDREVLRSKERMMVLKKCGCVMTLSLALIVSSWPKPVLG